MLYVFGHLGQQGDCRASRKAFSYPARTLIFPIRPSTEEAVKQHSLPFQNMAGKQFKGIEGK